MGRRTNKSREQKAAEKAEYDREYRNANRATLKRKKRQYYERTFDPVKMAAKRKARMPLHLEYCRRPEYRVKKRVYDQTYRADREYGPFAEAFLASLAVRREVKDRATDYDIRTANDTLNKTQKRKRNVSS